MPVPYIAQSDNTSVAPVKVMPVFDPKYKTTFAFTDQYGKRMFVTPSKAKNAVIKEDKRSKQEKEISQKRAQIDAQNQKEEREQQEAMQKLAGFGKFISPSTYVGPLLEDNGKSYLSNVAAGKGFGNGFINFAFDMSSPFLFKGAGSAVNKGTQQATYALARNGSNYARSKIFSNMLNQASRNWDGTVSEAYFNSPYNWYRITESPEVYGIKEMGKNVTTRDAVDMYIPSNQFRLNVIENKLTSRDGYWYKPLKHTFNFSKNGSAHGNTSQAAKGHLWQSTVSRSNRFPQVILEGDMPVQTYRGFNPTTGLDSRTSFHLVDSETIPMGARIGFHTGEMPIEGLRSFTKLSNGRYRYDGPVIPYRTVELQSPAISE